MTTNLLSVIEQQQGEIDALRQALVYVARASHVTPLHMLPKGVMLCDGDGVVVRVPNGPEVWGGNVSDYEKRRLATHPQAAEPAPIGCDYCTSPLYAGTKCKSCGRVNEPAPSTAGERDHIGLPRPDLALLLRMGWAGHTGAEPSESVLGRLIEEVADYLEATPKTALLMEPMGRCKWCLSYNGHQDGCPDAALLQSTADHIPDAGKMGATQKIGCVQHDCAECQARAAMPVGELKHLKGIDAGPLSEWVDLVKRGYVSKYELLIMEKDAERVAAARSHPTTEESSVVAGAQPVREPLTNERILELEQWAAIGATGTNDLTIRTVRAAIEEWAKQ